MNNLNRKFRKVYKINGNLRVTVDSLSFESAGWDDEIVKEVTSMLAEAQMNQVAEMNQMNQLGSNQIETAFEDYDQEAQKVVSVSHSSPPSPS